jgi:hypothetical protein
MKNKIKQTILIIMLLQVYISPIFSQESSTNDHVSIPKNQFGISVGIGSTGGFCSYVGFIDMDDRGINNYPWFFYSTDFYRITEKTPAFNISYQRNLNKFISLSLIASYTKMSNYTTFDSRVFYCYGYDHYISLMAGPKFNWYRSKNVSLYSTVAWGIGLNIFKRTNRYLNYYSTETPLYSELYFDFQISPIGVVLYDRFNLELGFGGTGFFKLGFIF